MAIPKRASSKLLLATALLVGLQLLPSPASADIGLPMLYVVWPPLILLLLPVIAVEAVCARRVLGLGWRKALSVSGRANLISTLLGVPIAWLFIVLIGLTVGGVAYGLHLGLGRLLDRVPAWLQIILFPAWIGDRGPKWQIPLAALALCFPFYWMSVWIESKVARQALPSASHDEIARWSRLANLWSYSLMAFALLALIVGSLPMPLLSQWFF